MKLSNTTMTIWGQERVSCMSQTPTNQGTANSKSENTLCHCPSATQLWATVFSLEQKVTMGSFCLLAPNTDGLFYQLSSNVLSTHTQLKKNFLSLLCLECFKFLRKLVPFLFLSCFGLFSMSTFGLWGQKGTYI